MSHLDKLLKRTFGDNLRSQFNNTEGIFTEKQRPIRKLPVIQPVEEITDEEKERIRVLKEEASKTSVDMLEFYNFSLQSGTRDISFIILNENNISEDVLNSRKSTIRDILSEDNFCRAIYNTLKTQFCNVTKKHLLAEAKLIYNNVLFYRDLYLRLLQINVGYVAPSEKHGNGLFAGKNLKKGDIITFFFPYYMETIVKSDFENENEGISIIPIISRKTLKESEMPLMRRCENAIDDKTLIIGDPKINNDSRFLGHFINDACDFYSDITQLQYEKQITDKVNTCLIRYETDPRILYAVAYKDIERGQEFLSSYGWNYWVNFGIPNNQDIN